MHWLFLLIGFALLVLSFLTTNSVVMVLCWLVALVLFGLWLAAIGLWLPLRRRLGSAARC